MAESQGRLTRARQVTEERLSHLAEAQQAAERTLERLADAQTATDEKLAHLIDTLQRNASNGGPPAFLSVSRQVAFPHQVDVDSTGGLATFG